MLHGVPRRVSINWLHKFLSSIVGSEAYNMLYMPGARSKHKRPPSVTYAFVNFVTPAVAAQAVKKLADHVWPAVTQEDECKQITPRPAQVQGILGYLTKHMRDRIGFMLVLQNGIAMDMQAAVQLHLGASAEAKGPCQSSAVGTKACLHLRPCAAEEGSCKPLAVSTGAHLHLGPRAGEECPHQRVAMSTSPSRHFPQPFLGDHACRLDSSPDQVGRHCSYGTSGLERGKWQG